MLVKRIPSVTSWLRKVKIGAGLGLALSVVSLPAYARSSQIHSNVKIKAVDLQDQSGVEKVYKRLKSKAAKACKGRSRDGKPKPEVENICQGHLMDDFIESVNDPNLTKYHQSMIR